MEPFTVHTSRLAPLDRHDVDTDQIIPKQFLKRIERTGFGEFLFWDWREEDDYHLHHPRFRDAEVLVTGRNFGCGSSREHAPWSLQDHGYRAIVAVSFADIFRNNCTKIGLLPVELPESEVRALIDFAHEDHMAQVHIDLPEQVVHMPDGRRVGFDIDPGVKQRLVNGWDDVSLTLNDEALIERYENEREIAGAGTAWLHDR